MKVLTSMLYDTKVLGCEEPTQITLFCTNKIHSEKTGIEISSILLIKKKCIHMNLE